MKSGTLPIGRADVVLFTVNRHETGAVNLAFGQTRPAQRVDRRSYWDLGDIGGAHVVHAVTQMGDQPTASAARAALKSLAPKLMICVGIAWGAKPDKWKIGEILLATRLHDWAHRKESGDDGVIPRGFTIPPSDDLLQTVRTSYLDWNPMYEHGKPELHDGLLLSNPVLYDDESERNKALAAHPEAIGGEMEGRGLVWVSHEEKCDWLVIKAICDWGAGKNAAGTNKEACQKLAARNAADFVRYLVESQLGTLSGSPARVAEAKDPSPPNETSTFPDHADSIQALALEVAACRNDCRGPTRRRSLHSILSRLQRLSDRSFDDLELRTRIWRELASEARTQHELSQAWKETLTSAEALVTGSATQTQKDEAYRILVEWSIDFAQSAVSHVGINTTLAQLNHVRQYLSRQIGPSVGQSLKNDQELGDCLCLRAKCTRAIASLLRRMGDNSKDIKAKVDKHKNEALRDAGRGDELAKSEKSQLELALCLFANSATPSSDEASRAMDLLRTSVEAGAGPLTRYELVKQYRLRYEFHNAIMTFKEIADTDTRRFHSNVTHFAASIIGLFYEQGSSSIVKECALLAIPWIEKIIAEDRHSARDLVDMCFLKAISGWPIEDCTAPLDGLKPASTSTWDELARMAKQVSEGDIGSALLLGLEDPVIWSRIGSFYAEFSKDYPTAIQFYERATRIAPLSPVFHFNKAEVLAYGLKDYRSARVSFEYAMRLKHRSYAWYKSIPQKISRLQEAISQNLETNPNA